jgi:hypothetical protein
VSVCVIVIVYYNYNTEFQTVDVVE